MLRLSQELFNAHKLALEKKKAAKAAYLQDAVRLRGWPAPSPADPLRMCVCVFFFSLAASVLTLVFLACSYGGRQHLVLVAAPVRVRVLVSGLDRQVAPPQEPPRSRGSLLHVTQCTVFLFLCTLVRALTAM